MKAAELSLVEKLQAITDDQKPSMTKMERSQAKAFVDELITLPMNFAKLRQKTFYGCPDTLSSFRPTVWKVLLNYLVASNLL
jgi:hypothetical protein